MNALLALGVTAAAMIVIYVVATHLGRRALLHALLVGVAMLIVYVLTTCELPRASAG